MSFVTGDRVKETTTTAGQGAITLLGAVSQFLAFSAVASNLDTFQYAIVGQSGTEWEVGIGTWNTGGTITRVAGDVSAGSAGVGVLTTFSVGTKDVFITHAATITQFAQDVILPSLNASQVVFGASAVTIADATTLSDTLTVTGAATLSSDLTVNGSTTVQDLNGGQLAGMRNRIINGDMRVDQRLPGSTVVTGTHFTVDRFAMLNNTATGTMTSTQSTLGDAKSMKMTATAAVTDLTAGLFVQPCHHRIESQSIYDLNSKSITISFVIETNWTGNLAVSLRNSAGNKSYLHDAPVVSGTNYVSFSVDLEATTIANNDNATGLFLYIGVCNEGSFETATKDAWIGGTSLSTTTSTSWAKTIGNFINVTEVQLEEGPTATPFESRAFGCELQLCQRYYNKSFDYAVVPGTSGANGMSFFYVSGITSSDHICLLNSQYIVETRSVPTIVVYDNVGTTGKITMIAGDGITPTISRIGTTGFWVQGSNGAASTARTISYHYTADSEL